MLWLAVVDAPAAAQRRHAGPLFWVRRRSICLTLDSARANNQPFDFCDQNGEKRDEQTETNLTL
jgi:hypothetical protein